MSDVAKDAWRNYLIQLQAHPLRTKVLSPTPPLILFLSFEYLYAHWKFHMGIWFCYCLLLRSTLVICWGDVVRFVFTRRSQRGFWLVAAM